MAIMSLVSCYFHANLLFHYLLFLARCYDHFSFMKHITLSINGQDITEFKKPQCIYRLLVAVIDPFHQ